ncbi:tetratricopeptide repeat protein [Actinoplanes sp. LDG1-06]|uniref:Tetratricopeptide repeat protein n=1 Tax=Paractinoplanes ovalisporus TaxID=2810368 RepID=A0ABS2APF4_9ACTN|nr:FxSxx-COOH system tetratricopeptide repeat protein [Actinoplanes ovalisporus]MBM2621094.1 tetratricopeptide repeat protein [Actinoplanes ovalisporus]
MGQVITFYSYKGGTGRTMALANVAWILAANGHRVLAVDWDLESPGLHRFFTPFVDQGVLASTRGVIDMIRQYEWETTRADWTPGRIGRSASVRRHAFSLDWEFPGGGTLDYLSAGQQNHEYAGALTEVNWDDFYAHQDGGRFFDAMRADMKEHYDYTLIDSRTGHSDIAGICTGHLPDVLVDCFTLSEQGIDGAAQMARQLLSRREIRVLPVPMRVDPAEKRKADIGRTVAMRQFPGLPGGLSESDRTAYWLGVQVPYQAYYAYEETLAAFCDVPGSSGTLLSAYEALVGHITEGAVDALPPMAAAVRAQISARFERKPFSEADVVLLSGTGVDHVWHEWVEHLLVAAGFRVVRVGTGPDGDAPAGNAQRLKIISRADAGTAGPEDPDLRAIYTADVPRWQRIAPANAADIAGVGAAIAAERILDLVGRPIADTDALLSGAPRFPGSEPDLVVNLPARNARFTGREAGLRRLREQLRGGAAVVLAETKQIALQGMGGVGKTQMAIEYAHRYRTAYDVVAWLNAATDESLESSLRDLGVPLHVTTELSGPEYVRAVVQDLSRDKRRWLMIFDNADEPETVRNYIPYGPGHVLITSRNLSWGEQTQPLQVDVFTRDESIDHLVQRVSTLTRPEADLIAEQLADLPIAVAAAGAWLAETGTEVEEYLRLIRQEGPTAVLEATDRSIARTWDLSLNRLRDRDPAAYRMFQLCSVMAPEISLDLVYSDQMAQYLKPYNPALSERLLRGALVQQINRLALLRLDPRPASAGQGDRGGQILIHRVVQNVVRDRMTDAELAEARLQVHQVLAKARPDAEIEAQEHWPRFRQLWPHLDASGAVHSADESVRQLLIDRVRYYYMRGDAAVGRERAERTSEVWSAQLADLTDAEQARVLHRQLLHLRFNMANLIRDQGEFELSRQVDEQVLDEQQQLLPANHAHILMTRGGYAADLRGLGRYPEALELDIETYNAWREEYGEEYSRTLNARNNLAVSYRLMGQFRLAAEHDEQVVARRRELNGETHIYTLASSACLARDWRDTGDFSRSAALLEQVLRDHIEVRGPDTRATLTTQANYAVSLRSLGRVDEAVRLHQDAYLRLAELTGPDSPDTVQCRLSFALSVLMSGDAERAAGELRGILKFYRERLGARHPYALVCMNDLAIAERTCARFDSAQALIALAAESLTEVLGPDHPYSLSSQMNLVICRTEPLDVNGGEENLRRARESLLAIAQNTRRVLGAEHPNMLRFEANLAFIEGMLGDRTAGDRVAALRARTATRLGDEHPIIAGLENRSYLFRMIDPHQF